MKRFLLPFIFCLLSGLSVAQINQDNLAQNQLLFIENKGQIRDFNGGERKDILFMLKAQGVNIFISKNSIHLSRGWYTPCPRLCLRPTAHTYTC